MVPDPFKGHRDQEKCRGLHFSPSAKLPVAWCSGNSGLRDGQGSFV